MAGWKSTAAAVASVVPLVPLCKKSAKCEVPLPQPRNLAVSPHKEMDMHLRCMKWGEQVRCQKMQFKDQEASKSKAIASICKENDILKSQATKDKHTVEDLQSQATKDKHTVEDLQSQVQLAETEKAALRTSIKEKDMELEKGKSERRVERLLATSKSRVSVMCSAFKRAAPEMSDFNCNQVAGAIDDYDDFDSPSGLRESVEGQTLRLHYRGFEQNSDWRLTMRLSYLPKEQRLEFQEEVHRQLDLQRNTFASRSKLQKACARLLQPLQKSLPDVARVAETIPSNKAKQVQYTEACDEISQALTAVFAELQKEGVDVEALLLERWMPLCLKETLATYSEMSDKLAQLKGQPAGLSKKQPEAVAFHLHDILRERLWEGAQG